MKSVRTPNTTHTILAQLIPEDYEYSSANDAAYVSRADGVRIEERAEVRVRIVGVRIDAAELVSRFLDTFSVFGHLSLHGLMRWRRSCLLRIPVCSLHLSFLIDFPPAAPQFCIGTVNEDYLGVISG